MIHKWITSFRSRLSAILDFKFILSVLPPSSVMKWFDNDAKRNQTKFLSVSRKQEKTLIENKRTFSLTVSNTAHSSNLFTFFFVRFFFLFLSIHFRFTGTATKYESSTNRLLFVHLCRQFIRTHRRVYEIVFDQNTLPKISFECSSGNFSVCSATKKASAGLPAWTQCQLAPKKYVCNRFHGI